MQLVSKISNLCDNVTLIHQRYRQTDGQTDRQTDRRTTCNLSTALCTSASRGKKHTLKYTKLQCDQRLQAYIGVYRSFSYQLAVLQSSQTNKQQESCAIAKTTARCALYIGYSNIILFTPIRSLLCADLILNEFKLIDRIQRIDRMLILKSQYYNSTQRRMPPCTQTSFRRIVLDSDAPSPIELPRMLQFIFLQKLRSWAYILSLIVYLSYLSHICRLVHHTIALNCYRLHYSPPT